MDTSDIIAWLIPSSGNHLALQAIQMRPNKAMMVKCLDESLLPVTLSITKTPALQLSFSYRPRGPNGIVLGTDPNCDIVLPKLPGISRRHCYITFDNEGRLILKDTSRNGTAVWYDFSSSGDKCNFSWVLSSGGSYGFPDLVKKIVLDIQTVRFQIIVNDPTIDMDKYSRNIQSFMNQAATGYSMQYDELSVPDSRPIAPDHQPVYLKYTMESERGLRDRTFLWNSARPWEPIVCVD